MCAHASDTTTDYRINPIIRTELCDDPVESIPLQWPDDCGAECIFLGRTRVEMHTDFGTLLRLEYEAYEPMAHRALDAMSQTAVERFNCRAVRIAHALGPVAPGQASVVIQTVCGHRDAAFAACRYLIDRLKRELPIWKREIWQRGETFVDGCTAGPTGETNGPQCNENSESGHDG